VRSFLFFAPSLFQKGLRIDIESNKPNRAIAVQHGGPGAMCVTEGERVLHAAAVTDGQVQSHPSIDVVNLA